MMAAMTFKLDVHLRQIPKIALKMSFDAVTLTEVKMIGGWMWSSSFMDAATLVSTPS